MSQNVDNNENLIHNQLNIGENQAPIYLTKQTRYAKRFEKFNMEVASDERY